jgi:hypothetical protein
MPASWCTCQEQGEAKPKHTLNRTHNIRHTKNRIPVCNGGHTCQADLSEPRLSFSTRSKRLRRSLATASQGSREPVNDQTHRNKISP